MPVNLGVTLVIWIQVTVASQILIALQVICAQSADQCPDLLGYGLFGEMTALSALELCMTDLNHCEQLRSLARKAIKSKDWYTLNCTHIL